MSPYGACVTFIFTFEWRNNFQNAGKQTGRITGNTYTVLYFWLKAVSSVNPEIYAHLQIPSCFVVVSLSPDKQITLITSSWQYNNNKQNSRK